MSAQPPESGPPASATPPPPETLRCPRCSAEVGPEQGWCLECGAPARTRLAPTPNWRLPAIAIAGIVLLAGALLAYAFVDLTADEGPTPSGTAPVIATQPPAAPPPVATTATAPTATAPTQTTTAPGTTAVPPTTVPGQPPPSGRRPRTATTPRTGN